VPLSTHYYVLSLGVQKTWLFESFRDSLIDIENQGFPVAPQGERSGPIDHDQLRELMCVVDKCFGHYHSRDPLKVVVVGDQTLQAAFDSVTAHGSAIIGRIESDHSNTSATDLGQIVWPVVKEAMSGLLDRVISELEVCDRWGGSISGLEAVVRSVNGRNLGTLLVEEDFRVKGSITGTNRSTVLSPEVDVREVIDDAVDAVIEQVLHYGGNVVFLRGGSLVDRGRIIFLPHGADQPEDSSDLL
jgi:hypothetical protein